MILVMRISPRLALISAACLLVAAAQSGASGAAAEQVQWNPAQGNLAAAVLYARAAFATNSQSQLTVRYTNEGAIAPMSQVDPSTGQPWANPNGPGSPSGLAYFLDGEWWSPGTTDESFSTPVIPWRYDLTHYVTLSGGVVASDYYTLTPAAHQPLRPGDTPGNMGQGVVRVLQNSTGTYWNYTPDWAETGPARCWERAATSGSAGYLTGMGWTGGALYYPSTAASGNTPQVFAPLEKSGTTDVTTSTWTVTGPGYLHGYTEKEVDVINATTLLFEKSTYTYTPPASEHRQVLTEVSTVSTGGMPAPTASPACQDASTTSAPQGLGPAPHVSIPATLYHPYVADNSSITHSGADALRSSCAVSGANDQSSQYESISFFSGRAPVGASALEFRISNSQGVYLSHPALYSWADSSSGMHPLCRSLTAGPDGWMSLTDTQLAAAFNNPAAAQDAYITLLSDPAQVPSHAIVEIAWTSQVGGTTRYDTTEVAPLPSSVSDVYFNQQRACLIGDISAALGFGSDVSLQTLTQALPGEPWVGVVSGAVDAQISVETGGWTNVLDPANTVRITAVFKSLAAAKKAFVALKKAGELATLAKKLGSPVNKIEIVANDSSVGEVNSNLGLAGTVTSDLSKANYFYQQLASIGCA